MTSFLNLDTQVKPAAPPLRSPSSPAASSTILAEAPASPQTSGSEQVPEKTSEEHGVDFEIVFGRTQIASTGLVIMVVLAFFSGVSYLIGKTTGARVSATPASTPVAAPTTPTAAKAVAPVAVPAAPAAAPSAVSTKPEPPLFAEAVSGQVYLQVGAIEKGLAGIWAEGLRTHGLDSFVAPGPSDKVWRVLVGPLPDPAAFQQARTVLDSLGIDTFGKRYQK